MDNNTRTVEVRKGNSTTLAFIVGGLVVAVGVILYLATGGFVSAPTAGGGGNTNVTIEAPKPDAPAAPAPAEAPAAAALAPATPAPAGN